MSFTMSGPNMKKELEAFLRPTLNKIRDDQIAAVQVMTGAILMRTPVYTGATLVNFQWSLGEPATAPRSAVKKPKNPGQTSTLRIGAEPRREANAKVIRKEAQRIINKISRQRMPTNTIYLVNLHPEWEMVEYGSYVKTDDGKIARTPPGGIVRAGEKGLKSILGNGR